MRDDERGKFQAEQLFAALRDRLSKVEEGRESADRFTLGGKGQQMQWEDLIFLRK